MDSLSTLVNPLEHLKKAQEQLSSFQPVRNSYTVNHRGSTYEGLYLAQDATQNITKLSEDVNKSLFKIKTILEAQQQGLEALAKRQGFSLDTMA